MFLRSSSHMLLEALAQLFDGGVVAGVVGAHCCNPRDQALGFGVFHERPIHQRVVSDGLANLRIEDLLFQLRVNVESLANALRQRAFVFGGRLGFAQRVVVQKQLLDGFVVCLQQIHRIAVDNGMVHGCPGREVNNERLSNRRNQPLNLGSNRRLGCRTRGRTDVGAQGGVSTSGLA